MELVNEQMQLMELALLQLRLDNPTNWCHPRNRGWRAMFERWSRSGVFKKYWQLSIPYYSRGLEAFGVNVLQLPYACWHEEDEGAAQSEARDRRSSARE
jgi:hypothetical protein